MSRSFARRPRGPSHSFRQRIAVRTDAARNEDSELKLFVLSFTAFFVCIYTLIF
ncbi:hypothetical protein [Sphingomonas bacterium]|uniref:hypothetical protein n=1 Tax=Sphingomonas bacterium TaxID=1895847 RepID=UPI0026079F8D|nr:hypothetical protein [Sphingomonas bacterium]MDB5677849.1 hypothetical protein [Sphingomonas bacterium]